MKKNTNKLLLVVFFALVSVYSVTKIFRSPALESNLEAEAFRIDTAKIATIKFKGRASEGAEMTLTKNADNWVIQQGKKTAAAQEDEVNNLLNALSSLRPERIVTRKEERWQTYEVDDSAAVQLVAYNDNMDELANWHIGKESAGSTFVRIADDDEVYALEGSLRNHVEKKYNDWRDKTFLRLEKTSINEITFQYPADSGFVLRKDGDVWLIGESKADSAKVEHYLRKAQSLDIDTFADGQPRGNDPEFIITLRGDRPEPIVVNGWRNQNQYVLESSLQKGVYFLDSSITKDLFVSRKTFGVK
jgi:hypothetical protein